MLRIDNFSLQLKGSDGRILPVLEDVSLRLEKGNCLGIAGESGSGKSVLAMSIAALLPSGAVHARSGDIEFGDCSILSADEPELRKLRGHKIGFVFQEPMTAMNPLMTLYDQIVETVYAHFSASSKAEADSRVMLALERAGFKEPEKFLDSYPHQLSGGMRQRAMIAMALVLEPELIIADEPTTAIDAALQVQLLAGLRRQIEQERRSMIFISHDLGVIRAVSDQLAVFYAGCLVESGVTSLILESPAHPYTADLVAAMPRLVSERKLPVPIAGTLPSPDRKPAGCVYSDRCRHAREECKQQRPKLRKLAGNWQVSCLFPLHEGRA
ncbi:MAG: dipeptide/oligopeptide/nickel ABC transporter ATP-binding protein [Candidatus Riflebacteria bacterium HGW-Riflebacteria-2]|nr:MAG: dipeptide/oligopeptide/nickel ABC transporter ATP-binding protein [Candidatus Riflebacteria bacterium HGW-Riflebacteria-2]